MVTSLYAISISACEQVKRQKLWGGLDPAVTLTFWPLNCFRPSCVHLLLTHKTWRFLWNRSHCFIQYTRVGRRTTTTIWLIFTNVLSLDLILWLFNMKLCVSSYLTRHLHWELSKTSDLNKHLVYKHVFHSLT